MKPSSVVATRNAMRRINWVGGGACENGCDPKEENFWGKFKRGGYMYMLCGKKIGKSLITFWSHIFTHFFIYKIGSRILKSANAMVNYLYKWFIMNK
jgi:hypothetical protein